MSDVEHCDYCGDPFAACDRRGRCPGAAARRTRERPTLGRVVHVWMGAQPGWRAAIVSLAGDHLNAWVLPGMPHERSCLFALDREWTSAEAPGAGDLAVWRWPPR